MIRLINLTFSFAKHCDSGLCLCCHLYLSPLPIRQCAKESSSDQHPKEIHRLSKTRKILFVANEIKLENNNETQRLNTCKNCVCADSDNQ